MQSKDNRTPLRDDVEDLEDRLLLPYRFDCKALKDEFGNIVPRVAYRLHGLKTWLYPIFTIFLAMVGVMGGMAFSSYADIQLTKSGPYIFVFFVFLAVAVLMMIFKIYTNRNIFVDIRQDEFRIRHGMLIPFSLPKKIIRDELTGVHVDKIVRQRGKYTTETFYRVYYIREKKKVFLIKVDTEADLLVCKDTFEKFIHFEL